MGLFGPSRRNVWSKVANELDGHLNHGGFFGKEHLLVNYRNWRIFMDIFTVSHTEGGSTTYTRLRAPFLSKTDFELKIRRANILSPVGKFLGMQDIEVGDKLFDKKFIIKSNDEQKVKDLLDDEKLKSFLSYPPKMHLEIRHEKSFFLNRGHPPGVYELYFKYKGVLKNEKTIFVLIALFQAMLDRLVVVDLALRGGPYYVPSWA